MAGHRVTYVLAAQLVNELVVAADERQPFKTIARSLSSTESLPAGHQRNRHHQ